MEVKIEMPFEKLEKEYLGETINISTFKILMT